MKRTIHTAAILAGTAGAVAAQCNDWSPRHSVGLDLFANTLEVIDLGNGPELFAGGDFLMSGTTPADSVARWTGSGWVGLGPFPSRSVRDLVGWDPGLGDGVHVYATTSDYWTKNNGVFDWDGTSWTQIAKDFVGSMAVFDDGGGEDLYVTFSKLFGWPFPYEGLVRWDGTSWTGLGMTANSSVFGPLAWDDGSGEALYMRGTVEFAAPPLTLTGVIRWDGTSWTTLEPAPGPISGQLAAHDDGGGQALYGLTATDVVRWDGSAWSTVAPVTPYVYGLTSHDANDGRGPLLVAYGDFDMLAGVPANNIACWDGSAWTPLGIGTNREVLGAISFADGTEPSLWAVGKFKKAGGLKSNHVAEWTLSVPRSFCTAGTTAIGCTALVSSTGTASRSAASGFDVLVSGSEGGAPGVIFFGTGGPQALPWGNGTSWRCVVPPLVRTGLDPGSGTSGSCDGSFQLDFNAWMSANPAKAPAGGQEAFLQCWFRDPQNTSNQVTSFSDGLRVRVCP